MWRICTLIIFLLLYICKRNGYELDEEVEKEAEVIDHEKADAFQMDAISDEHTNVYLDDHDNAVCIIFYMHNHTLQKGNKYAKNRDQMKL